MAKLKSGTRIYGTATVDTSITIGTGTSISSPTTNTLTLGTNNTEAIRVTSSGNIGIGITNPQSTFQVGTGITMYGATGIISAVSYRGDGSQLTGVSASGGSISISTNTTNQNQYIPYATSFASTTGFGATTLLIYNPSSSTLQVGTAITMGGTTGIISAVSYRGDGSQLSGLAPSGAVTGLVIRDSTNTIVGTSGSVSQLTFSSGLSVIATAGVAGVATISVSTSNIVVGTGLSVSGIATAASFKGDGTRLKGVDGQSFNTGISTSLTAALTGIGDYVLSLPSTTGVRYIIHSILASNIGTGNTEFNVLGAFDFNAGERSYFAYNIPIPTGTSIELLKQPQILNPSDKIAMRSTDYSRVGIDSSVQVYISYESKSVTDYFGVGVGTVGIAVTDLTTVYTSTTYPSIVQSIRLTNRTDSAGYPISVSILRSGQSNPLVNNLIVPKYASVELLDTQKELFPNDQIQVQVNQTSTIDVQVSGKQIIP
jgi:hypothetical protein